jgi:hypothetical protein
LLVVFAADISLAVQKHVLDLAKQYDHNGTRTIGVITKSYMLTPGDENQRQYLAMVEGREPGYTLPLGWTVVCSPWFRSPPFNVKTYNPSEPLFPSKLWTSMDPIDRGRTALATTIKRCVLHRCMENISRNNIQERLSANQEALDSLGKPRQTPQQIRQYMLGIAAQYERLARNAITGCYRDTFFLGPREDNRDMTARNIREVLVHFHREFELSMYRARHWSEGVRFTPADLGDGTAHGKSPATALPSMLVDKLRSLALSNQGTEFVGNNLDVMALHREQIRPWKGIAQRHLQAVASAARVFVGQLVGYLVGNDKEVMQSILRAFVDPFFESKSAALDAKLQELLCPYSEGYAVVLEGQFRAALLQRNGGHSIQEEDVIQKLAILYEVSQLLAPDVLSDPDFPLMLSRCRSTTSSPTSSTSPLRAVLFSIFQASLAL